MIPLLWHLQIQSKNLHHVLHAPIGIEMEMKFLFLLTLPLFSFISSVCPPHHPSTPIGPSQSCSFAYLRQGKHMPTRLPQALSHLLFLLPQIHICQIWAWSALSNLLWHTSHQRSLSAHQSKVAPTPSPALPDNTYHQWIHYLCLPPPRRYAPWERHFCSLLVFWAPRTMPITW